MNSFEGIFNGTPPQTRIQAEDYFQLPEYQQHDLIQLIDGEVIISMPPIIKLQRIVRRILILLDVIARKKSRRSF